MILTTTYREPAGETRLSMRSGMARGESYPQMEETVKQCGTVRSHRLTRTRNLAVLGETALPEDRYESHSLGRDRPPFKH